MSVKLPNCVDVDSLWFEWLLTMVSEYRYIAYAIAVLEQGRSRRFNGSMESFEILWFNSFYGHIMLV